MPFPGLIAPILGIGASLIGAKSQKDAASSAAKSQADAAQLGIQETRLQLDEARRQFDATSEMLAPYRDAGSSAIGAQLALAGLSGEEAEAAAIQRIEQGPQFQSLYQQGENAILQNASATGGLRGGNTQGALAQFRPQLLSQLIDQQYGRLGGLSTMGGNAAARTGNAATAFGNQAMAAGSQISNLFGRQGAAQAGGALSIGQVGADLAESIGTSLGQAIGGTTGFGGGGGSGFGLGYNAPGLGWGF